ncbi:MAG: single-stranded-DNA-specific exonuclease RecJ [Fidelibacterota bacterium]
MVETLGDQLHVPEIIARVLANRGIHSLPELKKLVQPGLSQLHDPFMMLTMEKSAEQVVAHIKKGKKILVLGDYDVDGVTGASMLYLFLKSTGVDVSVYIPDREKEGYGLSKQGVDHALEMGADLLITCDCGINAFGPVAYANSKGVRVIITDHHTPDAALPDAFAILNPKQEKCHYPFKGLCGGGVAFKLVTAVAQLLDIDFRQVEHYLDLVALGTAADLVPLTDENRVMVHYGLRLLPHSDRPGLRALLDIAGLSDKELTVGRLVFWVTPRINAAGRMGDARRAVALLTTDDFFESVQLAKQLDNENRSRQTIQQSIVDEALLMVAAEVDLDKENAIVLWKEGWHPGVIGIVASRIKDEYHRPVVVISLDGDKGKGSARSIRKFDLYENLTKCAQHLDGYGGHPMAAGLTIQADHLEGFRESFVRLANETVSQTDLVNTLDIDGEMDLNVIDGQFMEFLKKLAPYGPGNMRPQFVSRRIQVSGTPRLVGNGDHLKFTARQLGARYDAIGFNLARDYEKLITGESIDIAYVVEENEWKGRKSIQLNLRDVKPSGERES